MLNIGNDSSGGGGHDTSTGYDTEDYTEGHGKD